MIQGEGYSLDRGIMVFSFHTEGERDILLIQRERYSLHTEWSGIHLIQRERDILLIQRVVFASYR